MAKTALRPAGNQAGPPPLRIDGRAVIAQHEHAPSGARLILARAKTADGTPCYAVGWAACWQKNMRAYRTYPNPGKARVYFNRTRHKDPPQNSALCRDWQRNKVYGWEEDTLDKTTLTLDETQMKNVIRKISADFNLAAQPALRLSGAARDYSYYDAALDEIGMGHRTLSALLHELAHAIDMRANGNRWAGHGPGFMRTLITLAAQYQYWQDEKDLEDSARKAGLKIAPRATAASPRLP